MKNKIVKLSQILHPSRLSALANYLLKDEAISGKLIFGATILALIAANTALQPAYETVWHTNLQIGLANLIIAQDLRHWVNEGLMAIFFLVVGLELKRELVIGELRKFKTAILPFAAALGGMILPALIYISINNRPESFPGWAIPTATDIAFAVGVLALLGSRVPVSIRLFLLTLAIVDDIGTVIVIGLFYSSSLQIEPILITVFISALLIAFRKSSLLTMPCFCDHRFCAMVCSQRFRYTP